MKLSKRTQAVLKNFAGINQSIVIKPGKKLQTISNVKDVFAVADIEEEFTSEVAIYDVNEFLGVLSLFEDPDLEFTDRSVKISQGKASQTYFYADAAVITTPPEKGVTLPSVEVTGKLTREQIQTLIKAAGLNDATSLTFTNGKAKVWNSSTPNSNAFEIEEVMNHPADYELSIAVEKLKMIADDYDVEICAKGLSRFAGTQGIEYYVALQPNGKYGA
jgi:hypothetical protein